jgi:hypothetical protein
MVSPPDADKSSGDEAIPFKQAVAQIERKKKTK